jgi:membrane protease YdiL (CAAX protease family)
MLTRKPLLGFFFLSFVISWVLWIPLLYGHFMYEWKTWEGDSWTNIRTMLGILGSLGPALSAIILTYSLDGKEGVRLLLKRILLWRVNVVWWIIGFYAWWLIASIISSLLQLAPFQNIALQFGFSLINIPVIIFLLQMPLLIGMVGEELGWRGFALPRLLDKFDPIVSSFILALPWILWHIPLSVFQEWTGNIPIIQFLLKHALLILPLTLIFTWFFQKSKGSVLLVIVFHKAFNLTFNAYSNVVGLTEESGKLLFNGLIIVLWLWAAVLVVYYLRRKMKKSSDVFDNKITHTEGTVQQKIV